MTQTEQITEQKREEQHAREVERMSIARPDVPACLWDIEASEEMAQQWDEFNGWL